MKVRKTSIRSFATRSGPLRSFGPLLYGPYNSRHSPSYALGFQMMVFGSKSWDNLPKSVCHMILPIEAFLSITYVPCNCGCSPTYALGPFSSLLVSLPFVYKVLVKYLTENHFQVKEEVELSHENQAINVTRRSNNFVVRNLELRISNIISTLLTGTHIKDISGMPVTVTLIDSCTKKEVNSGPEASGKVEIVVIEDGRNEFDGKFVCHMLGKKSVRVNNLPLQLQNGTAVFPTASFARNKRWMKKSNIRLQARFVDSYDGIYVKEAQTEPFLLKDCRNEAYKKHLIPSLEDDVWRLYNIDRRGTLAGSLIEADIKTVGDFIVRLFLHPQRLEEIFNGAKHAKSLKETVEHALKCPAILKYSYSFYQNTEVIFNVSGEVLGLHHGDSFLSSYMLSEAQKEVTMKLVISAFKNWQDVIPISKDQLVARCIHSLDKYMLHDEQDLDLQFLPASLSTCYYEIYRGFEALCTSIRFEPKKNGSCKRWRKLLCVVTFTIGYLPKRNLDDFHAHKKRRLS